MNLRIQLELIYWATTPPVIIMLLFCSYLHTRPNNRTHRSSCYKVPLQLAYILTRLPTWSLTRSNNLINYPLLSTPFMYIYHLISIDLELSRSFNSPILALLQLWVRIALPAKPINLLPYLRSHYFYHLCKCLELLYLPNEWTVAPGRRTYPTDERTNKSN